jgi:hypothetical protein
MEKEMMMLKKCGWLSGVFFLFFLTGCGQEDAGKANVAAQPVAEAVAADQNVVGSDDDGEDDGDDDGKYSIGPVSRADVIEGMKVACVENGYPTGLKDAVKRKQFCGCLNDEVFGEMTNAEFQAWLEELAWRRKLLEEGLKRHDRHEKALDSATEAKLDRNNRAWEQRYAQAENVCMKRVGVTVTPAYQR